MNPTTLAPKVSRWAKLLCISLIPFSVTGRQLYVPLSRVTSIGGLFIGMVAEIVEQPTMTNVVNFDVINQCQMANE
ncbi:hypothetical protein PGTUg99_029442 [Puccinia graminis f. sp. tritici]|uniref:Uncharacterized protein n=1 Tax=Puccinia graminis f. sp. tritici TaxID=56615 RepID=A0A5B0QVJ4_PUCGR|nr:hypothetical protein PGTUg99_029442 [Puccinia graminis f. sp. tritici]